MGRGPWGRYEDRNEAAIDWLKLLLALVTAASLTVIYFLLPDGERGGQTAGFLKDLFPNLIAALIVFPVVFIVLGTVGQSTEDRLARTVRQSMGSREAGRRFTDDVAGTADFVHQLVSDSVSRRVVHIEILAFTGGTFTTALLRDLVRRNPNRLSITLRTIDFARADKELFPRHWEGEQSETVERLRALCDGRAGLEIWKYPSFPFLLGLAIDRTHLLIAFPRWDHETGRLADTSLEYRYYERNSLSEHLFELFENWARQPRQELLRPQQRP
ncbi:hypothetical protein [Streptomyces aidingensis]|uniref:Uncharacterized protein n=1 Tax=Streptomyces aidingensis TaxID=910347 RepID=A0A1I1QBE0_9ACTN|nr:hypothetical protein [Streptomyces aidingensis]SFD16543.1 hypothetical protein SAMN05421773_110244 [Streptomyces aidingensis]